jgi:N-acetylglucosamine-6-phosphate deacetylase
MKIILSNGRLITPFRVLKDAGVVIEDGIITEIIHGAYDGSFDRCIDAQGNYISPGFIDMHTHGGGGYDNMDGTHEAIMGAAKTHMRYGTTSLTPTSLSSSDEELFTFFDCFKKAKKEMVNGPNLLGIHLEGPYVSPKRSGAQDAAYIKDPEREHLMKILSRSDDIVRISAAPELPGGMELGRELRKRGILASICHSDALYETVLEACENGYNLVTHFYSGNSTLSRPKARRELGIIETAYLIDELWVEIIADGIHLPPELLKLIIRGKPSNRICLTTDSMRGAGMPEGQIVKLGSLKNGQDTIIENGVAMMMHHRSYGGSICTTDRCVRTMVKLVGLPVEDAVRMMSLNPARVMGIRKKGILSPGMDADICVFGDDIRIKKVVVGGRVTINNGDE